jgi:drug/metabolite transporter (DMT)-like permease
MPMMRARRRVVKSARAASLRDAALETAMSLPYNRRMPGAATLLALLSIVLWSFLALLSSRLAHVPALLVTGIALCIGGLVGVVKARQWKVPLRTFLVGLGGIFGYHVLLFAAFRHAPAVEANLMNYLWPLLIVLLSPLLLPGFSLRAHHVVGALLGIVGAGLIVTGGRLRPDTAYIAGYALAAAAALTWSCYSLLTKRLPPFSSAAVGGFCLSAGVLSLALCAALGQGGAVAALSGRDWLILAALGIGPMGAAFFTWDAALKKGDPRVIGSLSYVTPLLSTFNLVVIGGGALTWVSGVAMALIVAGALVGSLDLLRGLARRRGASAGS